MSSLQYIRHILDLSWPQTGGDTDLAEHERQNMKAEHERQNMKGRMQNMKDRRQNMKDRT